MGPKQKKTGNKPVKKVGGARSASLQVHKFADDSSSISSSLRGMRKGT